MQRDQKQNKFGQQSVQDNQAHSSFRQKDQQQQQKNNQTQRQQIQKDDDLRRLASQGNTKVNETHVISSDDQLKFDSFDHKNDSISEEELILLAQEGSQAIVNQKLAKNRQTDKVNNTNLTDLNSITDEVN